MPRDGAQIGTVKSSLPTAQEGKSTCCAPFSPEKNESQLDLVLVKAGGGGGLAKSSHNPSHFHPFSPSLEGRTGRGVNPSPRLQLNVAAQRGQVVLPHSHSQGAGVGAEVGRREILTFKHILSTCLVRREEIG